MKLTCQALVQTCVIYIPLSILGLCLHGVYVLFLFISATEKLLNICKNIYPFITCTFTHTHRQTHTPARRQELGCRLLAWRCPSHFVESPRRIRGRHYNNSYGTLTPGDSSRSETCPPLPGFSDPSQDVLATTGGEKNAFMHWHW